ncbi:MAG: ComF family protein [Opitutales bacterium]|nr:ComF family protein [Opitutales bacterium]
MLDVFFPRDCLQCGEPVDTGSPLKAVCAACFRRIHEVRSPACQTCGYPIYGKVEVSRECPHCQYLRPFFQKGLTTVVLRGAPRKLVHELKYHGNFLALSDMKALFRRSEPLREFLAEGGILVPVPLHPRRQRERGFNQSHELAKALAGLAPEVLRVEQPLKRVRDTDTQTQFTRQQREKNLKNAFAIHQPFLFDRKLRFILVDDVFTTGSTLNACAAVLSRAGCKNLAVVTFGHG